MSSKLKYLVLESFLENNLALKYATSYQNYLKIILKHFYFCHISMSIPSKSIKFYVITLKV